MSFQTTSNFINKYGQDRFKWLLEQIEAGKSYEAIGRELGLSKGRVCQIVQKVFHFKVELDEGAKDALKFYAYVHEADAETLRTLAGEVKQEAPVYQIIVRKKSERQESH